MLAFCHIPKNAGMAINRILKSNLGIRFVASTTWGKKRPLTTARDLTCELLPYPRALAIAGHGIRPFVDYGDRGRDFRWFTILRDPVTRAISHYVYNTEKGTTCSSFEDWLQEDHGNYQVRWIAGKEDLDRAKEILDQRFAFVGLQEQFRESLVLIKHILFSDHLHIAGDRRVNASGSSELKQKLRESMDQYQEIMVAQNGLDLELYEHARTHIWPRQVAVLGTEELARRMAVEFSGDTQGDFGRTRRLVHDAYRSSVYKPGLWLARALGVRT